MVPGGQNFECCGKSTFAYCTHYISIHIIYIMYISIYLFYRIYNIYIYIFCFFSLTCFNVLKTIIFLAHSSPFHLPKRCIQLSRSVVMLVRDVSSSILRDWKRSGSSWSPRSDRNGNVAFPLPWDASREQ